MINSLRHIGIVTKNIDSSIDFYKRFFKFEIFVDQIEKGDFIEKILGIKNLKVRTVKLRNENFMIEFLDFGSKSVLSKNSLISTGCTHFALNVKNLKLTYEDLIKNDVKFISGPTLSKDKRALVCFMKDPNNDFYIELVEQIKS